MNKSVKLMSLMARKEKVKLGEAAAKLKALSENHEQAKRTLTRIEELIQENKISFENITNPAELATSHWFGSELAAKADMTRDQAEQTAVKKTVAQTELARAGVKQNVLTEKAKTAARKYRAEKEQKQLENDHRPRKRD